MVELRLDRDKPYLQHVKNLGKSWPHLKILADFMEIGTSPQRWKIPPLADEARQESAAQEDLEAGKEHPAVSAQEAGGFSGTKKRLQSWGGLLRKDARGKIDGVGMAERASRTNICRMDYLTTGAVLSTPYDTPGALQSGVLEEPGDGVGVKFRLFVVEDLSRDVIEILGSHFLIDPSFFREHILDYAWYNVRDPYRDPPNLNIVTRQQPWLQLRFVIARYFASADEFRAGFKESENFNVQRRPDDDENNHGFWDKEGAKIGVSRARASFWVKPSVPDGQPGVGMYFA
jgi:hypothetical protein